MFITFVDALRRGLASSASLKEHLLLLEALDAGVIAREPEQFYYLARAIFVHDESQLDRFDQVFGQMFKGLDGAIGEDPTPTLPEEWLKPGGRSLSYALSRWPRSRRSDRGTRSWRR